MAASSVECVTPDVHQALYQLVLLYQACGPEAFIVGAGIIFSEALPFILGTLAINEAQKAGSS